MCKFYLAKVKNVLQNKKISQLKVNQKMKLANKMKLEFLKKSVCFIKNWKAYFLCDSVTISAIAETF